MRRWRRFVQLAPANLKIINSSEAVFGFIFDVADDNKKQIKACHSIFAPNDSDGVLRGVKIKLSKLDTREAGKVTQSDSR